MYECSYCMEVCVRCTYVFAPWLKRYKWNLMHNFTLHSIAMIEIFPWQDDDESKKASTASTMKTKKKKKWGKKESDVSSFQWNHNFWASQRQFTQMNIAMWAYVRCVCVVHSFKVDDPLLFFASKFNTFMGISNDLIYGLISDRASCGCWSIKIARVAVIVRWGCIIWVSVCAGVCVWKVR